MCILPTFDTFFCPCIFELEFLGAQFLAQCCISAGFADVLSVAQVLSVPAGNTGFQKLLYRESNTDLAHSTETQRVALE